jgi:hypothetical protein
LVGAGSLEYLPTLQYNSFTLELSGRRREVNPVPKAFSLLAECRLLCANRLLPYLPLV